MASIEYAESVVNIELLQQAYIVAVARQQILSIGRRPDAGKLCRSRGERFAASARLRFGKPRQTRRRACSDTTPQQLRMQAVGPIQLPR